MARQGIAEMLQPWQSAEAPQKVMQSLLEILLEVLPVNLARQEGRLRHVAMLHQGNLVHEDSKLAGSQLKAQSLEALSQLLHINAWFVPAKKRKRNHWHASANEQVPGRQGFGNV